MVLIGLRRGCAEGCASLDSAALMRAYELVRDSRLIPREEYDDFADQVERASQKMFMDWFDHAVAIGKASIQGTLEGRVDPDAGYIDPGIARMMNEAIFAHVPAESRRRNQETLHSLMLSPFGTQLSPLFIFVGPRPLALVMSRDFDEEYPRGDSGRFDLLN